MNKEVVTCFQCLTLFSMGFLGPQKYKAGMHKVPTIHNFQQSYSYDIKLGQL